MAIPAWNWPPGGAAARGSALVPFGSGMVVADWSTPTLWPFAGGAFSAGIALAGGTPGLCGAASDGTSGVWALTYDGLLFHRLTNGTLTETTMPTGSVYVGCASEAAHGSGFALSSAGTVYRSDGTTLAAWSAPAIAMAASGTTLFGLLPASGVGTMDAIAGGPGVVASPGAISTPSCLIAGSGAVPFAIGGWRTAAPLAGMAAAGLDPQTPTTMLAVGGGLAILWQAPAAASEAWTQTQALTGLASLSAMAWRPDGTQVLAASVSSGIVQVINDLFGVLSLAQTISISGACSVMVADGSANALVARSGTASLLPLVYGGTTWTPGPPITGLTGIAAVAAYGSSGAVAASANALTFLGLVGGNWSVTNTIALAFTPTVLTVDPFLNVYAAGSGVLAVAGGNGIITSGNWTGGAPTSIVAQQGRVVMAVDGGFRNFGRATTNMWTQQSSGTWSLGTQVGLALSETTLFAMGTGATNTYGFSGTPFTLTPVRSGVAAQWSGSAWTTTELGIGHLPSACGFDASGNLHVATIQNTLWSITSGGAGTSGIVPQYPGQPQTVPIGPSAVTAFSGGLYVATSLPGVLIQLSGSSSSPSSSGIGLLVDSDVGFLVDSGTGLAVE